MKPFFSIIIATYNRSNLISKAIQSVIKQSFDSWELIIIDDGSNDDTGALIQTNFNLPNVFYHYQENKGRSVARNKGIEVAKGEFICFLDSDDYFLQNHLEVFHRIILQNAKKDHFYYGHTYEDNNGKLTKVAGAVPSANESVFNFLFANPIGTPRVCIRAQTFKINQFNSNISIGEDSELWLRLMPRKIVCTGEYTQAYVNHLSRSIANGVAPLISNLELRKMLYGRYKKRISRLTYNKVIGYNYLKLARYWMEVKKREKASIFFFKSLMFSPFKHTKEKLAGIFFCLLK